VTSSSSSSSSKSKQSQSLEALRANAVRHGGEWRRLGEQLRKAQRRSKTSALKAKTKTVNENGMNIKAFDAIPTDQKMLKAKAVNERAVDIKAMADAKPADTAASGRKGSKTTKKRRRRNDTS
jgi:hypothetical protein